MANGGLGLDLEKEWSCLSGTYTFHYKGANAKQRDQVLVKYSALALTPNIMKRLRTYDLTKRVVIREPKPLSYVKTMLPEFRTLSCDGHQDQVMLKELYSIAVMFGCLNFLIDLHQKVYSNKTTLVIKEYEMTVDLKCIFRAKLLNSLNLISEGYAPVRIIQAFKETFFDMNINDEDHNNWRLSKEFMCARTLREKIASDNTFCNLTNIGVANMLLLWNEMQTEVKSQTEQKPEQVLLSQVPVPETSRAEDSPAASSTSSSNSNSKESDSDSDIAPAASSRSRAGVLSSSSSSDSEDEIPPPASVKRCRSRSARVSPSSKRPTVSSSNNLPYTQVDTSRLKARSAKAAAATPPKPTEVSVDEDLIYIKPTIDCVQVVDSEEEFISKDALHETTESLLAQAQAFLNNMNEEKSSKLEPESDRVKPKESKELESKSKSKSEPKSKSKHTKKVEPKEKARDSPISMPKLKIINLTDSASEAESASDSDSDSDTGGSHTQFEDTEFGNTEPTNANCTHTESTNTHTESTHATGANAESQSTNANTETTTTTTTTTSINLDESDLESDPENDAEVSNINSVGASPEEIASIEAEFGGTYDENGACSPSICSTVGSSDSPIDLNQYKSFHDSEISDFSDVEDDEEAADADAEDTGRASRASSGLDSLASDLEMPKGDEPCWKFSKNSHSTEAGDIDEMCVHRVTLTSEPDRTTTKTVKFTTIINDGVRIDTVKQTIIKMGEPAPTSSTTTTLARTADYESDSDSTVIIEEMSPEPTAEVCNYLTIDFEMESSSSVPSDDVAKAKLILGDTDSEADSKGSKRSLKSRAVTKATSVSSESVVDTTLNNLETIEVSDDEDMPVELTTFVECCVSQNEIFKPVPRYATTPSPIRINSRQLSERMKGEHSQKRWCSYMEEDEVLDSNITECADTEMAEAMDETPEQQPVRPQTESPSSSSKRSVSKGRVEKRHKKSKSKSSKKIAEELSKTRNWAKLKRLVSEFNDIEPKLAEIDDSDELLLCRLERRRERILRKFKSTSGVSIRVGTLLAKLTSSLPAHLVEYREALESCILNHSSRTLKLPSVDALKEALCISQKVAVELLKCCVESLQKVEESID